MKELNNNEKEIRKQAVEIKKLFKAIATRGDQTALEDLFYQFSGRIRAYAETVLYEKDSAEDVTTEVFIKIAYLDSLARISNPVGWMFRVTKNLCNDYNRRVKYNENIETAQLNYRESNKNNEIDKELALLPDMQREVITLEVIGNMSQRDIAEHLGITRAQVRKERALALEKLESSITDKEN